MWPIASFPGEKRQSRLAPVPAQTPRAVGAARVPAPRRSTWECTEHSTRRRDAQQRPAKRSSSSASPKPHQSGRSRRARAAPKALRLRAAPQGTQERFRTRGDVIPRRREAPGVGPRRPEALVEAATSAVGTMHSRVPGVPDFVQPRNSAETREAGPHATYPN